MQTLVSMETVAVIPACPCADWEMQLCNIVKTEHTPCCGEVYVGANE